MATFTHWVKRFCEHAVDSTLLI